MRATGSVLRARGSEVRRAVALGGVAVVVCAALGGCSGSGQGPGSSGSAPARKPSPSASLSDPPSGSGSASASPSGSPSSPPASTESVRDGLAALRTAQRAVAHSTATRLVRGGGARRGWRVELVAAGGEQWRVRVSEGGGKVVGKSAGGRVREPAGARIDAQEALRLATGRHAGAELRSVEFRRGGKGALVWTVNTAGPAGPSGAASGKGGAQVTRTRLDARTGRLLGEKHG